MFIPNIIDTYAITAMSRGRVRVFLSRVKCSISLYRGEITPAVCSCEVNYMDYIILEQTTAMCTYNDVSVVIDQDNIF